MFTLEAVSAQRLYRLIAERIAEKIRSGEFPVDSRLPAERDLAEMLQVSRSSVREALIALELSGFVEVRVGSGVTVIAREGKNPRLFGTQANHARTEIQEIASDIGPFELLEARLLIEPECAALAAQLSTDAQKTQIRAMHENLSNTPSPRHHDRAFHLAIAAACGNSALEAVVTRIWDLADASPVYAQLDKHFVDEKVWGIARREHERIALAILERDPIRARHAMYAHLIAIMARLREDFADSLPKITAVAGKVRQLRPRN